MKNRKVIAIFVIFSMLLFFFRWFYWDILNFVTPFFVLILTIILSSTTIIFAIYSVCYATINIKQMKQKAFIPIAIMVVLLLICMFFPFT